ncbi:MAG: hypothetical protein A2951_01590 [Candidatus Buchananbacteria bacterium RIFCSPLOWO2_01_FULL_56_15]|uniref:Proteinase inhibitor I42 chagasin domain-containing protein n=2 Tax=Candidatus Buchananiibacteriota TaxID=1817903 RepID=A0A1G1YCZ9_9BACT|nr:MAG: hypothetical protein A3J59_04650 [Candidatus Buchananbacteria bacterium RIFCSPHIGHO2_02_FULL_56_16]OGY54825.1 MAG: hypothetical protein A2951_01590 [Candidatus Buchananbacteria bacterium RIFCSPLOWO2_01_FULL_56_15]
MKKSLALILFLALLLAGCGKRESAVAPAVVGVPETGVVIDLSERNGSEVTTRPGDVLYLKLTGEGGSGKQWTTVSPTSSDCLILKDQQVANLTEPAASSTFQWWFKVEQTCRVDVRFDYGKLLKKADASFGVHITSQ